MVSRKTVNTLLASVVILSGGMATARAEAPGPDQEKCYGIAKPEAAISDADGSLWIALPKGTCTKLILGSLSPAPAPVPVSKEAPAIDPEAAADAAEHSQE